jgi:hypothetical protein
MQEVTYLILYLLLVTSVVLCFFSPSCIALFAHTLLYFLLFHPTAPLHVCGLLPVTYVSCMLYLLMHTRASSNDFCVAWCNSSWMWASSNDLCVAHCTSLCTWASSSDLCVMHCNSLHVLCPPLDPFVHHAGIAFVAQRQTWEVPVPLF